MFVRLMRDAGFDFEWYDKYCNNLFAKGHEKKKEYYEMITAFELMEHLEDPQEELFRIFSICDNLVFSTSTVGMFPPKINEWWYYATETGQHIAFYTEKSLTLIAEKHGKILYKLRKDIYAMLSGKVSRWKVALVASHIGFLIEKMLKKESLLQSDYNQIKQGTLLR